MAVIHKEEPKSFVPEYLVEAPTGYATSDDGMQTIIRFATPGGGQLMIVIPTMQVEAVHGAMRDAKRQAAAKTTQDVDGQVSVFIPKKYETIRTPMFDGVLLAFDRDEASQMMIGLDDAAAHAMGKDLRKLRHVPEIIRPNGQLS